MEYIPGTLDDALAHMTSFPVDKTPLPKGVIFKHDGVSFEVVSGNEECQKPRDGDPPHTIYQGVLHFFGDGRSYGAEGFIDSRVLKERVKQGEYEILSEEEFDEIVEEGKIGAEAKKVWKIPKLIRTTPELDALLKE